MSASLKNKVRSANGARKAPASARIASFDCKCKDGKSFGDHSWENHKSCGKKKDPAVEGVQEAGKDLSEIFKHLKKEENAEMLVKAIRHRNAKAVQCLLGCHCKVVCFFCTRDKDCVKICCAFGRCNDVSVTFDICIKKVFDPCGRKCW